MKLVDFLFRLVYNNNIKIFEVIIMDFLNANEGFFSIILSTITIFFVLLQAIKNNIDGKREQAKFLFNTYFQIWEYYDFKSILKIFISNEICEDSIEGYFNQFIDKEYLKSISIKFLYKYAKYPIKKDGLSADIKKLQKDVSFINKNLCKHCISDEIFKNSNKPA